MSDFTPDRYEDGLPDDTPMVRARFGQPESIDDLINQYGTYNIQPTNEQENTFPMILQGMPAKWRKTEFTKENLESMG